MAWLYLNFQLETIDTAISLWKISPKTPHRFTTHTKTADEVGGEGALTIMSLPTTTFLQLLLDENSACSRLNFNILNVAIQGLELVNLNCTKHVH